MAKPQPPRWAIKFLRWFCRPELADEIQGDLTEEFNKRVQSQGPWRAWLFFVFGVIGFLKPFAVRRRKGHPVPMIMLRSYLVVTWRDMVKHKLFTAINVAGLSLSMSVGLLIIILLADIYRFDTFHANKDHVYRIISTVYDPTRPVDEKATAPIPLAEKLASITGVESVVRITRGLFDEVVQGNNEIPIEGYFTDPSFFTVFSFPMNSGNPGKALNSPFSIVLTQATAERVFNNKVYVGSVIKLKSFGEFTVTGILDDIPKASHLQFDALISYGTVAPLERDGKLYPTSSYWNRTWRNYVYFLLEPGQSANGIESVLADISAEVYNKPDEYRAIFDVQRLLDIVPGRDLSTQIGPKMLYLPIYILIALAVVIILSACFNYTNLSIARSLRRAKEVGLRKINGAARGEIIGQFMLGSVVVAMVSLLASIGIFAAIRKQFLENGPMLAKVVDLELSAELIPGMIAFGLIVGIIASAVPSFLISHVKVLDALRQLKSIRLVGHVGLRNGLTIFQFTISLFILTAISIVYSQYRFSVNHELGFDKENILSIRLQGVEPELLAHSLESVAEISSVSFSSLLPATASSQSSLAILNGGVDSTYVYTMSSNAEFQKAIGLKFLAGRNFPDSLSQGKLPFAIINRKFLTLLKSEYPMDGLGKVIHADGRDLEVIGVVEDFNHADLEDPIEPFFITSEPGKFSHANVKVTSMDMLASLSRIEEAWKRVADGQPFYARFYDDEIELTYGFYLRLVRLFSYVGLLALVIATLGLLGMATYTTEARMKEIGIRKVMGARESQIVVLLSRGFLWLLGTAAAIALPAAYLLFDQVVLNFNAYRITISPLEMSFGLILMLLIGGGAIASQTLRAARANPAETLRAE